LSKFLALSPSFPSKRRAKVDTGLRSIEGILVQDTATNDSYRLTNLSRLIEIFEMGKNEAKPLPAFGFLTVLEDPKHGYFGGYLLLSELGRPLEFHCSTPVLPNEAQKILYGDSLRPYVLGELIGQTLVEKAELPVQAILTDLDEMLSLTLLREESIVCLAEVDTEIVPASADDLVPAFVVGNHRLYGSSTCNWQPEKLLAAITLLASRVALTEPFQRIHEAIREAQRITEHPSDNDHESSAAA